MRFDSFVGSLAVSLSLTELSIMIVRVASRARERMKRVQAGARTAIAISDAGLRIHLESRADSDAATYTESDTGWASRYCTCLELRHWTRSPARFKMSV
jgi:hypothetical protein